MNGNYSPEHQNIEYKSSWRDEYLKWVSGFAKMIQSCKLAHFPEPIISETAGGIQVVFKKPEINLKVDLKTNLKINLKNGGNLLTLMQQHPQITIPELSVALGKSKSSIKIYIQHLKQEGKIERVGAKKGGIWKVLDKKID